jgi:hypothetical protein
MTHPAVNPMYVTTPVLAAVGVLLRVAIDRGTGHASKDIGFVAITFVLSQVQSQTVQAACTVLPLLTLHWPLHTSITAHLQPTAFCRVSWKL